MTVCYSGDNIIKIFFNMKKSDMEIDNQGSIVSYIYLFAKRNFCE